MTQPYGQQQPGGDYPGSGGFPQPGSGGFPQAPQPPAYQQGYGQQGYGGMPQAPQEYGGPMARPGVVMASAVLAYVQAGITAVTTILVFAGAANNDAAGGQVAVQVLIGVVQAVGVALLIAGAVQLTGGKSRTLMIVGCAVELVVCLAYIVVFLAIPSYGLDVVTGAKAVLVGFAIFFAIMPTISLVLALGQQTTQFLQSRSGRPA
jgi:hypothetical protein